MAKGKVLSGKPYAGNPHVRFDEGNVACFPAWKAAALAVVAVMASAPSWAAERTWDGGGTDDLMSTPANWSGDTAPGFGDTAIVHANAAKPAVVPDGATTYATLVVGGHGSTAQTHEEGVIIQTNGTLTVSGNDGLRIGRLDNCPGTYIISNGTLKATTGSAFVGIHGTTGRLVIAGDGVVTASGMMVASPGPNTTTDNKTYGYIEVSENGKLDVSGNFYVGNASGGKGYYGEVRQTGGKVHAGTLYVAAQSTGHKYIQSGGTNAVNNAHIGPNANTSGTYELSGGLFSVTNSFYVGDNGTGRLDISGTGEIEARKHLYLGGASGKTGTIVQTGGSVRMAVGNNSAIPYIGYASSSTGIYEISGGTFTTTGAGLLIGNNGTGTVDISGTAMVTIDGNVNLGFETSGKGTLKLRDGGKLIANHVKKYQGTATLVEFDGGTLQARQADTILKDLANIELKAGGLALETAGFNLGITNCVFNVTPGGKISVTGGGTVTFKADTSVNLTEKPASAFTFAETDGVFSGMPVAANMRRWKMVMAQNRKSIRIVPPGLMIIVK